ncbi:ribonuclease H-like domain-containing protein [Haloarchaeobius sp. HRN-SO-5]|uniref:ribonuclease H-like domain-containing protein n=1 Tax=Haloarchaeobius sp. HRN-SO-5 TaxID=3446118 RepID=UPI003EBE7B54
MAPTRPTVVVLSGDLLDDLTSTQLLDCTSYADADAVCASDGMAALSLRARGDRLGDVEALLSVEASGTGDPDVHRLGDVDVVVATTDGELAAVADLEREGRLDPSTETYVFTDRLAVDVDPVELSATLTGREAYLDALSPTDLDGSYTHVTTEAPAGYRRRWDDHVVVGCGVDDDPSAASIPLLTLAPDGTVCASDVRPGSLGLRAIRGVGVETARRLGETGYRDPAAVADATVLDLSRLDGVSRNRAETLRENASALVSGEVVRRGDEGFPDRDPVFVDVETDGLSPTAVWLVGVLDRTGEETYCSFLATDPDEPGRAVEAFVRWYATNAAGRPIAAYNGHGFDFPVLREHVGRHCPEYLDTWEAAPRFDPLSWARDGNAVLPGRTNQLDDVAVALGHESADTGLTGAVVARRYRRWARDRTPEAELDWERHERYCEDDVRALACVYDALDEARRTARGTDGTNAAADTTQGRLSDF